MTGLPEALVVGFVLEAIGERWWLLSFVGR